MTFFYDLNKRMADLASKQTLAESKQAVEEGSTGDYSAKKAAAGKDIGKPGKAFGAIAADAAKRYGSKEKGEKVAGAVLKKLRAKEDVNEADMEEGNEFSGALANAKAAGAKEFEVGGKKYQVKEAAKPDFLDIDGDGDKKEPMKKAAKEKEIDEGFKEMDAYLEKKKKEAGTGKFDKKQISTGTVYTRKHEEEDEEDEEVSDKPKKKGRKEVGAGKGKKIGAKSRGTSKLASKGSIAEDDMIPLVDKGEYDREGDMALNQLHQIEDAAEELHSILDADENLPEWVQSKITKAVDYIDTARDYMKAKKQQYTSRGEIAEPVAEKAVSKQQQKFMGMAHAMQKGEKIKGASPELKKVAKSMKKSDVEDFAATKHKGLPKKVKEADAEPKAAGGIKFGQGVYESINSRVEKMITEGMNISVNATQNAEGENHKSITVTADGDDADKLAQLLNLAGLSSSDTGCGCGQTPCGCEQVEEAYGDTEPTENKPDYPTDAETTGEDDELLRRWAGGLNKPKSTGQTTVPVIASQVRRQTSMEESVELERSLFKTWQNYKG
jgi:hypothetical protein